MVTMTIVINNKISFPSPYRMLLSGRGLFPMSLYDASSIHQTCHHFRITLGLLCMSLSVSFFGGSPQLLPGQTSVHCANICTTPAAWHVRGDSNRVRGGKHWVNQTMSLPQENYILVCLDKNKNDTYGVEYVESHKRGKTRPHHQFTGRWKLQ